MLPGQEVDVKSMRNSKNNKVSSFVSTSIFPELERLYVCGKCLYYLLSGKGLYHEKTYIPENAPYNAPRGMSSS